MAKFNWTIPMNSNESLGYKISLKSVQISNNNIQTDRHDDVDKCILFYLLIFLEYVCCERTNKQFKNKTFCGPYKTALHSSRTGWSHDEHAQVNDVKHYAPTYAHMAVQLPGTRKRHVNSVLCF